MCDSEQLACADDPAPREAKLSSATFDPSVYRAHGQTLRATLHECGQLNCQARRVLSAAAVGGPSIKVVDSYFGVVGA